MTFRQGNNKEYLATMHQRRHVTDKGENHIKRKYIFK